VGCNTSAVTADFKCPDATGQPNGPPISNLFTNTAILANDVTTQFGPFPCTMPDIGGSVCGAFVAAAGLLGGGFLEDGTAPGGGRWSGAIDHRQDDLRCDLPDHDDQLDADHEQLDHD